jgi:hypothetical protein
MLTSWIDATSKAAPAMPTQENEDSATPILRAGAMVRVVNPRSEHYGNTGHVIGRSEQREGFWLVRFTTTGDSVLMVEQELEVVTRSVRGQSPGG